LTAFFAGVLSVLTYELFLKNRQIIHFLSMAKSVLILPFFLVGCYIFFKYHYKQYFCGGTCFYE
jgi:putative effector of murein hydrolase